MKTTETKLLTVQVPLDADKFRITPGNVNFDVLVNDIPEGQSQNLLIPKGSIFITTAHKENGQIVFSPGFEPEKYVERLFDHSFRYKDYTKHDEHGESKTVWNLSATDSFLSRIKAENGDYFDNPLGEKPKRMVPFMHAGFYTDNDKERLKEYEESLAAWQEAESKVVKNKLVVLGVKES